MTDPRDVQILVVPKDGSATRTWDLPASRVRLLKIGAGITGVVVALFLGSWIWLALQARQVPVLEARISDLEVESARVGALASQLVELEARYEAVRRLFGVDTIRDPSDLWLPPPDRPSGRTAPTDGSRPEAWPLSQPGFITRALFDGADASHPGLDIAVPTGTYIRAAGAGVVVAAGEDPIYGFFVELDHGDGLSSLYGHASRTLVEAGQVVRPHQVIALSGNTGRSTAPHLHFEIRVDGEPVDPLEYVRQPG